MQAHKLTPNPFPPPRRAFLFSVSHFFFFSLALAFYALACPRVFPPAAFALVYFGGLSSHGGVA